MGIHILNVLYIVLFGLFVPPGIVVILFWFCFLLNRIFHYYSLFRKEVSRYNPLEFDINVFNLKVKFIINSFLLLLILTECFYLISYSSGILWYNLIRTTGNTPFPVNIELNCSSYHIWIWELEIPFPLLAFTMALGDMTIYFHCILMVTLIKFIFIAYQCKTNFKSVKIFLIKASLILPILLTVSVIPQTQFVSKILTSIFGVFMICLLFKHRRKFFLILKWRRDDAFILRDEVAYKHHSLIMRNSKFSFNLFILSYVIFIISLMLDKLFALIVMLFTDKSRYITAILNLDYDPVFLSCEHQQIIYSIYANWLNVQPGILFVVGLLYMIPFYALTIWLFIYKYCRGIDSRYIRFEGNAHLYHPLRN